MQSIFLSAANPLPPASTSWARKIGEGLDYDNKVLYAACFLHDIEMSSGHPKSSAEKSGAILRETGFTPGKIDAMYEAILQHMPGEEDKAASIECKLLPDVNLLETVGALGLVRIAIGSFFWHHLKTMGEVVKLLKRWRSQSARSSSRNSPTTFLKPSRSSS